MKQLNIVLSLKCSRFFDNWCTMCWILIGCFCNKGLDGDYWCHSDFYQFGFELISVAHVFMSLCVSKFRTIFQNLQGSVKQHFWHIHQDFTSEFTNYLEPEFDINKLHCNKPSRWLDGKHLIYKFNSHMIIIFKIIIYFTLNF